MFKHENIVYNPIQQETAEYVERDCNIVVLAPTSSGKTIIAEQFIHKCLGEGKRAIYLSPLKALTQEKLDEWNHIKSKIAITSDHFRKPKPIAEDLVLMTTEALDSKTRGVKRWLQKVGVLVVDEAHLLSSLGRGDATEIGLTRFAYQDNQARIVLLSATIPNASQLGKWLTVLNGKRTEVIESDWRPIKQVWRFQEPLPNKESTFNTATLRHIDDILESEHGQVLIFVHAIAKGSMISETFGIPFHNARINKEQRHKLEEAFRLKKITKMVATSTLAYGVNLPADVGIVVGAHRGPVLVDVQDLKQEAGRIGRYGLSDTATVYFLLKDEYYDEIKIALENIPIIKSVLNQRLYFHLASFIAREGMQKDEISNFLSHTLAAQQGKIELEKAFEVLEKYKLVEYDSDGNLVASQVTIAAARMYIDPVDLFFLKKNLHTQPQGAKEIAVAFSAIPSRYQESHVPSDLPNMIKMGTGNQTIVATGLYHWLSGKDIPPQIKSTVFPIIKDSERWMVALSMCGVSKDYTDRVAIMMDKGVSYEMTDLVSLPRVGRKRALTLYKHGIETGQDLLEKEQLCRNLLGDKNYDVATASIRNPGKIILDF